MEKKEFELPKEFAEKWVKALRSEKYEQGTGAMVNNGAYCCLGVACRVQGIPIVDIYTDTIIPFDELFKSMPDAIKGMASENTLVGKLVSMNDCGTPFPEIADWIEQNVKFKS